MSPIAQRIAIAKACGFRPAESSPFWMATPKGKPFKACKVSDLPDYLNDLNAMHEAEKVLTPHQQNAYALQWLPCVLGIDGREYRSKACEFLFVTPTATQRAEAFLRTLNLWEDSK